MIHEEVDLKCGTKLTVLQAETGRMVMLRIKAVDRPLESIAQVKGESVTVAIDPDNFPQLETLFAKIFKPTPWEKFLVFVKGK